MTQLTPQAQALRKKILALLRKADSTDSEHEAQAFASKARDMMREHAVEQWELHQYEDALGATHLRTPWSHMAYAQMAGAGAAYLGCTLTYREGPAIDGRHRPLTLHGRESSRVTALVMVPFWWDHCMSEGRRLHRKTLSHSASWHVVRVLEALAVRLYREAPVREALVESMTAHVPQAAPPEIELDPDAMRVAMGIPLHQQMRHTS